MGGQGSAHKASYVLRLLCDELGYTKIKVRGRVVRLTAAGRPPIDWEFTNKQKIAPRVLRRILIVQIGLSADEAEALLRPAKPDTEYHRYKPRPPSPFLDGICERVPHRVPPRWRHPDGWLFEWDQRHGNLEGYNKRGKHLGVFDVSTGERIGPPVRGRDVDV